MLFRVMMAVAAHVPHRPVQRLAALQSGVCQLADGAQWVSRWHEVIELGDSEQGFLSDIGATHGNRGSRQIGADIVNLTRQSQTDRRRISTGC